jgi:hypothetical protein
MEVDVQSLFGLNVTWCAQLLSLAETLLLPSSPSIWTRVSRALLVSKDRRHLFVTPCLQRLIFNSEWCVHQRRSYTVVWGISFAHSGKQGCFTTEMYAFSQTQSCFLTRKIVYITWIFRFFIVQLASTVFPPHQKAFCRGWRVGFTKSSFLSPGKHDQVVKELMVNITQSFQLEWNTYMCWYEDKKSWYFSLVALLFKVNFLAHNTSTLLLPGTY